MSTQAPGHTHLRVTRAGIDTYQQLVVYMHRDCEVWRAESFAAMTRVRLDDAQYLTQVQDDLAAAASTLMTASTDSPEDP